MLSDDLERLLLGLGLGEVVVLREPEHLAFEVLSGLTQCWMLVAPRF